MRVGINLLYLLPGLVGGTETYATALLGALSSRRPANDYVVFVNREAKDLGLPESDNFSRVVCPIDGRRRGARYLWEQAKLPGYASRYGLDILHSLGYVGPLRLGCPHAVTIHDMNYFCPDIVMPLHKRLALRRFVGSVARRADAILTVSEFSKAEITDRLGIPAAKISVTHLAPRSQATLNSGPGLGGSSKRDRYIVAFGSSYPHKNIPALVRAFTEIAPTIPHRLVIVGHLPSDSSVQDAIENSGVAERILVSGFLAAGEAESLLAGAEILAFPSLYEGFGLPVLDAQAAGVAVAASSVGSIPEIAGDGALLFDPRSDKDIARVIQAIAQRPELRARLIHNGLVNAAKYSWARTADATLQVYNTIADAR